MKVACGTNRFNRTKTGKLIQYRVVRKFIGGCTVNLDLHWADA